MAVFSSRTGGYKGGVILLFFATAVYVVGFGAPFWSTVDFLDYSDNKITYYKNIWMLCVRADVSFYTASGCSSYGVTDLPAWFHAVRGLEILSILALFFACIYALVTNCRSMPDRHTRYLEISAALAGLLGFTGCMVYVGMRNNVSATDDDDLSLYLKFFYASDNWTIDWAFYLAAVGSCLCVIAAIIVAITNKPLETAAGPGAFVLTPVAANVQTGYPSQPVVAQAGFAPKAGYPAVY